MDSTEVAAQVTHEANSAGPLAEFAALRTEILQSLQMQWNIFALQLTATAALFSFSLSSPSRTGFLLILPFVTYFLSERYLAMYYAMQQLGSYIKDELSSRVPGGLHWEAWYRQHSSPYHKPLLGWFTPLPMIFPGTSVVAILWVAPYVWLGGHISDSRRITLGIAWILSLVFTVVSLYVFRKSGGPGSKIRIFKRLVN
jgi:hypothetical protein